MRTKKIYSGQIDSLISNRETSQILFGLGIPECPMMRFECKDILFLEEQKQKFPFGAEKYKLRHLVFGYRDSYPMVIDLLRDESIHLIYPQEDIFLNSSLKQFVGYMSAFNQFAENTKRDNLDVLGYKAIYIKELENRLIEIDRPAYFNQKSYFWGAYLEDFEHAML